MALGTLQPDGTVGYDTYIAAAAADTNYGTATTMSIGNFSGGGGNLRRALIKFDLTSIPFYAVLNAATLSLTVSSENAGTSGYLDAFRVLSNWVETEATWNIYSTGHNWGTAGCAGVGSDRESTTIVSAGGSFTATQSPGDIISMTLTPSKVQDWVAGSLANYGMLIKSHSEDAVNWDAIAYHSSDATTAENRPKLILDYTLSGHQFTTYIISG